MEIAKKRKDLGARPPDPRLLKKEKDKRIKNKGLQYPGKPRTVIPDTVSPMTPDAVRRAHPHGTADPRAAAQNEKALFSAVFFA